jgi:uroporphyrinogen-III synthase
MTTDSSVRMLVTRPEPDAQLTVARLRALDIDAVAAPLLKRTPLSAPLPPPERFAGLALTSANGLRALAERGAVDAYRHLPVYAVGTRTAIEAEVLGFPKVFDAGGTLADLAELIIHAGIPGPVFHPAGQHRSGDLARSVADHGVIVDTVPMYDMVAVDHLPENVVGELEAGAISAVLFYSSRTAKTFVSCLGEGLTRQMRADVEMLCLSETVAAPLVAARCTRISLADQPEDSAMMALALAFAREQNRA